MALSPESLEKQVLQWKEELKNQRDRQTQAQAVAADATQKIAMIEGGIQFANSLATPDEPEVEGAVTIEGEGE